jgi:hypothetical protein
LIGRIYAEWHREPGDEMTTAAQKETEKEEQRSEKERKPAED